MFTDALTSILDEMAPIKKFEVWSKYAPWLSASTKQKISERDLAQEKAARTGETEDWKIYKKLRNNINNTLKKEKKLWHIKKINDCEENSSNIWRNVKDWLGWNTGGPPTQLIINGELKTKPGDLAEGMNNFFIGKVRDLQNRIPPSDCDPLKHVKKLMKNRKCKFELR